MTDHAVAIVGGGPTGLMLAAELALAGVDAAIVERRATRTSRVPTQAAFMPAPSKYRFPGWDPTTSALIAEVEMTGEPEFGIHRNAFGIHSFGRREYEIRDGHQPPWAGDQHGKEVGCHNVDLEDVRAVEHSCVVDHGVDGTNLVYLAGHVARLLDVGQVAHHARRAAAKQVLHGVQAARVADMHDDLVAVIYKGLRGGPSQTVG